MNKVKKSNLSPEELQRKYHQNLVFNYAEYPTCDHWDYNYRSDDYKKSLIDWLKRNPNENIFFYVHIPFCEQLCWFCTCSKFITKSYDPVKEYLPYLYKEIDMLFNLLNENNIKLNVGTVFFGGGSPTILNREDLKFLVDKLKKCFDWSKVEDFTVEIDPRRVDADRLMYNFKECGANRLSFGMQDFDETVQRRVNRIQPFEMFENILTNEVREAYETIAFDLLVGQPGQTKETMKKTCDQIIELKPTKVQTSLLAYKPWIAKAQIRMVEEGPLPDFMERKELLDVINDKLEKAGYIRVAFESYALPSDPMVKAKKEGKVHYGAAGTQRGGRVNFVGVGSSTKGNLGDEYYSQNTYALEAYKKSIDKGLFPIHRGMKLSKDDKIRQYATQQLRTYWHIDYEDFRNRFGIDCKKYFKKEIESLSEMATDGLVEISDQSITVTKVGYDFAQFITNHFDVYDPPEKTYVDRLATIKKAKKAQEDSINYFKNL
jgi:oxygen-independent coproporphyrinogen III oxidase